MSIAADSPSLNRPTARKICARTRLLPFAAVLIAGATAHGKSLEAALSSLQVLEEQFFLDDSTQTLREFARQYGSVYHDSLKPTVNPDHLGMLDDRNLAELFDALLGHALYSESGAAVDDAQSVFPEIVKRNLDSRQRVESFHDVCMLTHRFRFAGILSRKYPAARLQRPPRIIPSPQVVKTARILDVSAGSNSLRVITPAWTHGPKIIMLFSPDCGPSLRAVSFIESKPLLRAHFEARSILIAPPSSISRFPDVAAWNSKHPRLRNYIAYSIWDWPLFERLMTPTFYFVMDGEVRWHFSSWMNPSIGEENLIKGMRSIGLNPDAPPPN